jgi:hypothetical protein
MKNYVLGLIGLALLGGNNLRAQHADHGCSPGCVCEHYTKDVEKKCYSCGCETICVANRWGFCKECTPMTRYYLIKKVTIVKEDHTKCVPAHSSAAVVASHPVTYGESLPAPTTETVMPYQPATQMPSGPTPAPAVAPAPAPAPMPMVPMPAPAPAPSK